MAWLGIGSPYPLTVATSPEVRAAHVRRPGYAPRGRLRHGLAGPYDRRTNLPRDPCDPRLSCLTDGSQYLYATCTEINQGLCKGTLESCTTVGYARPTPIPAGWPCGTP